MTSKEGFEAIKVSSNPDRYVIMEGNGRLCGTRWAFPDNNGEYQSIRDQLQLQVNVYTLQTEKQTTKAIKRITKLRAGYHTDDFETLVPPSLDEKEVESYMQQKWRQVRV